MEHEFFCPAFVDPVAALSGEAPLGACTCGVDKTAQVATTTPSPVATPPATIDFKVPSQEALHGEVTVIQGEAQVTPTGVAVTLPTETTAATPTATSPSGESSAPAPEAAKPKRTRKPKTPKENQDSVAIGQSAAPVEIVLGQGTDAAAAKAATTAAVKAAPSPVAVAPDVTPMAATPVAATPVAKGPEPQTPITTVCGACWGALEPGSTSNLCAGCEREQEREARASAPKEAPKTEAPKTEEPKTEEPSAPKSEAPKSEAPKPEEPKKARKPRGKKSEAAPPSSTTGTESPKLTDGDKALLLEYISKNICVGCRQGLLLEGDGMEAVVPTSNKGWTPITSQELQGEKWHRSCLEQKYRLEDEGRIEKRKDGTYAILPEAAKVKPTINKEGDLKVDPIPATGSVDSISRKESTLSNDDPTPKAPVDEATFAEAKAAYEEAGMTPISVETVKVVLPELPSGRKIRVFVGIDPGLSGYQAVLNELGEVLRITPVPTTTGDRPVYDEAGMIREVKIWKELGVEEVLLEQQQPFPKVGSIGNFKKGLGYGLWRGILLSHGIRFDTIQPIKWKKAMGIAGGDPKDVKKRAITKAGSLFPGVDLRDIERSPKARTPNGDKAESLLLSRYVMILKTGGVEAANEFLKNTNEASERAKERLAKEKAEAEAKARAEFEAKHGADQAPAPRVAPTPLEQAVPAPAPTAAAEQTASPAPAEQSPPVVEAVAPASPAAETSAPADSATPGPSAETTSSPAPDPGSQAWINKMTKAMSTGEIKGPGINGPPRTTGGAKSSKPKAPAKPKATAKAAAKPKAPAKPKAVTKPKKVAKPKAKKAGDKKSLTDAEKAMRRVLGIR